MKAVFRVIIVFAVIVIFVIAGRNLIVKFAVEKGVRAATGLPLEIKEFNLGLIATRIEMKDLSLFNPEGFTDRVMFHAPEIFVDYKLWAILAGKIHLEEVRLDFDQFVVVKNAQGLTNLDALKPKEGEKREERGRRKEEDKKKWAAPKIRIDRLVLKIGKVVYKDYSGGGKPVVTEYNINISEELADVTDAQWLLRMIAAKALAKTALITLIDFPIDIVKDAIGVPKQAVDTLKDTVGTLKEAIKKNISPDLDRHFVR